MNLIYQQACPGGLTCYTMTSVREFIVICARSDAAPAETVDELWTYNTICCIWKRYKPPMEFFNSCCSPETCSENNTVYICGRGYNGDDLQHINFIVSFDVINTKWTTLYSHTEDQGDNAPPPIDVILHFCHNGSPYVIGIHQEEEIVMMLKL
ncbi:hypothetical protein RF11_09200 [Thelohanellus kitauei]|uniref:Uncharacterized protein n=1 Tax=Thelohanellus kitauei TaxID=669202 RepID=A0A0C2J073_THEKT|nr:hypothetical protein RF11_09200 [Thelohanellus kitauei]